MHNCSDDVLAHHDEEVTLPQSERTTMRDRRDANRDRLKKGLKNNDKPAPREFVIQGSHAMKTMPSTPTMITTSTMVSISTKGTLSVIAALKCRACKPARWSATP